MKDNKSITQKPEDYMDEEDIREAEESKQISTNDGFSGFGTADDPSRGDAMVDLFRPAEDSMGVKLLNKMGWKQGQGIGPRVKRHVDADDPSSEVHLFAPEDVPMIAFVKKNDFKGVDYKSGVSSINPKSSNSVASNAHKVSEASDDEADDRPGLSFASQKKKTKPIRKGGLGVGILNDTGSDDDDPYSMGPKISYNRTLGGDKKPKKKTNASSIGMANPLLKKKPVFISKKLSSMQNVLRKCHDGKLPLAGFVLADELDAFSSMSLSDEKYKPPQVPEGWKPSKLSAESAATSTTNYQSTSDIAKASTHTHSTRASALGETLLPGKSVFDYLSPSARDRLVKATGKTNLPQALNETLEGSSQLKNTTPTIDIPYLDPQTASQALTRALIGGFMPYAEDLPKRQRYRTFLEISAGTRDDQPSRPAGTSPEDYKNELNEFVRAAEVFRPVSDGLGSRFTSSSTNIQSSLQPNTNLTNDNDRENLVRKPPQKPEDPSEVAAKLGMFGPLTRSILTFAPTRLIARRFGVEWIGGAGGEIPTSSSSANAYTSTSNKPGSSNPPSASQSTDLLSTTTRTTPQDSTTGAQLSLRENIDDMNLSADVDALISSVTAESKKEEAQQQEQIDADKNDAIEGQRPGQAVFRAIFGSDDEDDDDDE